MEAGTVVDMSPWVSVIAAVVGWSFFLIAVSMFKNLISRGFSMAVAEFWLHNASDDQIQKMVRWFGNSDVILEHLKELKEVYNKK